MAHQEFTLDIELPKYGVSEALRPHLIRYLIDGGFSCGDPFLRDRDVVKATGRSRSAIRLALNKLQDEGWIERRGGAGTFVGPKVNDIKVRQADAPPYLDSPLVSVGDVDVRDDVFSSSPFSASERLLRLAIVASGQSQISHSSWWMAPQLRGIDSVSEEYGIAVEFLGDHTTKPQMLSRRFKESRPDVLVSSGSPLNHMAVFSEAQRYRIPCILCAVRTPEVDVPNLVDDAENAVADAVQHLYDKGHRRIAYASATVPLWWTFDRYEGYKKGLKRCGLEDSESTLWLPKEASEASSRELQAFIDKKEPTAIIFSCSWAAANMKWLTGRDGIHVGEELSVVVYDQNPEISGWLGGVEPTVIAPPLYEMGKLIAEFARRAVQGQEIPPLSVLPCTLVEGSSVKDLNEN